MSDHEVIPEDLNGEGFSEQEYRLLISRIKQQWQLANPQTYEELGERNVTRLARWAAQSCAEFRETLMRNMGLDWWTADEIASEAWRWPNMDELDDEKLRRPRRPRLIYLAANLNQLEQKKEEKAKD